MLWKGLLGGLVLVVVGCCLAVYWLFLPDYDQRYRNVLRVDVYAPFDSLDPYQARLGSTVISPLLHGLPFVLSNDGSGRFESEVIETLTYDRGSYTWELKLREDVAFHDGRRVTAEDVEYSLMILVTENKISLWSLIDHVAVTSDRTVEIKLTKDYPDFLKRIQAMYILPAGESGVRKTAGSSNGCGPFKLKSRKDIWQMSLSANEQYFRGRSSLDEIEFFYVQNTEESWKRLLTGLTDVIFDLYPYNYKMMQEFNKNVFWVNQKLSSRHGAVIFNTEDHLLKDWRIRRAISLGINRNVIANAVLSGYAKISTGPMGIDSPYRNPEIKIVPYEPLNASSLIQDAGWVFNEQDGVFCKDGRKLELTLSILSGLYIDKKVAEYIKLCLDPIGILVKIQPIGFEEISQFGKREKEFQALLMEIPTAGDEPERISHHWGACDGRPAFFRSSVSSELDRLLCDLSPDMDEDIRKSRCFKAESIIVGNDMAAFIYQRLAFDVASKRMRFPYPFFLSTEGIWNLQFTELNMK